MVKAIKWLMKLQNQQQLEIGNSACEGSTFMILQNIKVKQPLTRLLTVSNKKRKENQFET